MTTILVSRGQYDGYRVGTHDGTSYVFDDDIDVNGNDLIDVDDIISNIAGREIRGVAAGYEIRIASGEDLDIIMNATTEYVFATTTLDMQGNFLSDVGLIEGSTVTNDIDDTVSGWIYDSPTSHRIRIGGTNELQINNEAVRFESNYLEGVERADPAAPAANEGRLYFRDNGAGKTQLVVRFTTGAIQVIATQP